MREKYISSWILFGLLIIFTFVAVLVGNPMDNKEVYALGDRTLKWGSRGADVKELQRSLNDQGFNAGRVDGIYGPRTAAAVRNLQKDKGLTPDGIAGPSTLALLTSAQITAERSVPAASKDDVQLLARAVYGEARGEPYVGQVAVAAVVLNRVRHPSFPNSIAGVIFQPGAFTAVSDGQIWLGLSETAVRAATDALNGWDPSNGALYYWNPAKATSGWIWTRNIHTRIGKHVFGL
ncbi:MAG: spore cortex-lytic enzyme [Bacillota bacterium]